MRWLRSSPALTWLRLTRVCPNSAAMPRSRREKLTCPANNRLDHLRAVLLCGEDELALDFMLSVRLFRVMIFHAGNKLKPVSATSKRAAPKANASHPRCRSNGMAGPLPDAHCKRRE